MTAFNPSVIPACRGSVLKLDGTERNIAIGDDKYEANAICVWQITVNPSKVCIAKVVHDNTWLPSNAYAHMQTYIKFYNCFYNCVFISNL